MRRFNLCTTTILCGHRSYAFTVSVYRHRFLKSLPTSSKCRNVFLLLFPCLLFSYHHTVWRHFSFDGDTMASQRSLYSKSIHSSVDSLSALQHPPFQLVFAVPNASYNWHQLTTMTTTPSTTLSRFVCDDKDAETRTRTQHFSVLLTSL